MSTDILFKQEFKLKKKINIVCRRQKDTQANTSSEEANYQTYQSEGLEYV